MVHGGRPHRGIRAVLAGRVALIGIREGTRLDTAADGRLRTVKWVAEIAEIKDLGAGKALLNLRHQR
jgi:hypothetical protein